MKIFDSHCHLDDRTFRGDRTEVLEKMAAAGVLGAMTVGITRSSSEKGVKLAKAHPNLFASVGVHPHDAKSCSESTLSYLKELAGNPKVRAWGETGLDFNRMFSPQEIQEKWFLRQIEMADGLDLPLIFHERDSGGRFLSILKETHHPKRRGVVHCFSGNKAELEEYLALGYHIGITGILTVKKRGEDLRSLVPIIPEERILVETDAPYLTPTPERNHHRRNEPAFVKTTLLKLAEVLGKDPVLLSEVVWENTCRLFDVDPLLGSS